MSVKGSELRNRFASSGQPSSSNGGLTTEPRSQKSAEHEPSDKLETATLLNKRSAQKMIARRTLCGKVKLGFRTLTFLALLILTVTVVVGNLLPSWILCKLIPQHRARHVMYARWLVQIFGSMVVILTALFAPVKIYCYGDWHQLVRQNSSQSLEQQKLLIMANHQMYADWWYIWLVARQLEHHGDLKFILRSDLKRIPILGWGMGMVEFIFMARKWITDGLNLFNVIKRLKLDSAPLWLVIFPEGTVVTKDTLEKSAAYGKKMNITQDPQYSLLPKTTGLHFISRVLQSNVHDLWDLTIGFSGVTPQKGCNSWPYDVYPLSRVFYEGEGPNEVHIFFRHFDTRRIPGVLKLDDEARINHLLQIPNLSAPAADLVAFEKHARGHSTSSLSTVASGKSSPPLPSSEWDSGEPQAPKRFARPHSVHSQYPTADESSDRNIEKDADFIKAEAKLSDQFGEWLRARFLEKDQLMRYFYRHGRYFNPQEAVITSTPNSPIAATKQLDGDSLLTIPPPLPPAHVINAHTVPKRDLLVILYLFVLSIPYFAFLLYFTKLF